MDRNYNAPHIIDAVSSCAGASLSARRAWIEMQISVTTVVGVLGRSPQGERG